MFPHSLAIVSAARTSLADPHAVAQRSLAFPSLLPRVGTQTPTKDKRRVSRVRNSVSVSVSSHRVARKLGIEHVGGVPSAMEPLGYGTDTVLPTVLIIDPARTIVFADLTDNCRVRPEPSTFLAALDARG